MVLYILMFLTLWGIGGTIWIKNPKDAYFRWLAASLFVGGLASFSFAVPTTIIPFLKHYSLLSPSGERLWEWISVPAFLGYWYGLGYCFLMCSIYFSGFFRRPQRVAALVLLAIPVMVVLVRTADYNLPFTLEQSNVRLLNGIYIAVSCILYGASWLLEKEPYMRRNRLRTTFVLSSALLWAFINDFAGMQRLHLENGELTVVSNGYWQYNYFIILWIAIFFLFYGAKYGFFGIKLRIEEQKHDYSMRNLTHGTQILNHTIKNEIQKIRYLNGKAMSSLQGGKSEAAAQALQGMETVTDHLLEMVNRIRDKSEDIRLQLKQEPIAELLDSVLGAAQTMAGDRMVIERKYEATGNVLCDPSHLREVLNNLVLNALEAVPSTQKAVILVRTRLLGKRLYVTIQDNGQGIGKENLERVFAPFFSTKKSAYSYGLGLSYCFAVMQKHGGRIGIEHTEPGKGTTMYLLFARRSFHLVDEG